jgi:hypothetical protein
MDISVSRLAATTQVVYATHKMRWGESQQTMKIIGIQRKPPLPPSQQWRRKQVEAMPTITRLAREGRLRLCCSMELSLEAIKGTYFGTGGIRGDLLAGITLEDVPAPIERSKFQEMDLRTYTEKDTFVTFCKVLLHVSCCHNGDYYKLAIKPRVCRVVGRSSYWRGWIAAH